MAKFTDGDKVFFIPVETIQFSTKKVIKRQYEAIKR